MYNSLFTWEFVASFVGMTFAVNLITQLAKSICDRCMRKIKTEKLVYIISFIVVGIVVATTENFAVPVRIIIQKIFTAWLNSILVAFTSIKAFDNVWSKLGILLKKNND